MKRRIVTVLCIASMCVSMTGCNNTIPELTEEQSAQISEYAAVKLLSYDEEYPNRLLNDEEIAIAEAKEARLKAIAEEVKKAEEAKQANKEKEQQKQEEGDDETSGGESAEAVEPISLAKLFGFDGVDITYTGHEICDSYPTDSSDGDTFFAMNASSGNKLVVMKFQITNQTGEEQQIDILSKQAKFRVSYNGKEEQGALTTMLLDDMTTLDVSLAGGNATEAVVVIEVEEAASASVSSLELSVKVGESSTTVKLQ